MERTIRVTGKGRLSVRPDTTRLILIMEGLQGSYDRALEQCKFRPIGVRLSLETV